MVHRYSVVPDLDFVAPRLCFAAAGVDLVAPSCSRSQGPFTRFDRAAAQSYITLHDPAHRHG
jgi:hypothetical protein